MAQPAYHHGDLRQQAQDHALALLHAQGDTAITLRALARHLGVTAPALYRHFRNRETLLAALAAEGFRQLRTQLLAVPRTEPLAWLADIGQAYIAFAQAQPNLYRLMFGGRVLPRGTYPELDAAGAAAFAVLQNSIGEALDTGYLSHQPAAPLAAAAWSLVHGFALLSIDGHLPREERAPGLARTITGLFLPGITNDNNNI